MARVRRTVPATVKINPEDGFCIPPEALQAAPAESPETKPWTPPWQVTDVPGTLERARRAAAEMARATEELNQTLVAAEKAFAQLNLGVVASVRLWTGHDDDSEQRLRFGKDGKEWRFIVESGFLSDPEETYEDSPLMSASRELRARAVDVLPELFEALVKAAEARSTDLNSRVGKAKGFLQKLEAK